MERLRVTRLGDYRLDAMLGRGNRASVYQATRERDGETVALRVFDRVLSADPDFVERFSHQAGLLGAIRHPNLLANSEYGQHDGQAYIVRPFVRGGAFRGSLGRPLPLLSVIASLRPIAAALDYAHAHGVIHGDVKPGSILLPRHGPVLLSDLGVAQLLPRGNSLLMAATGRYYGTPEYLSPEQAHGLPLDSQTDTYALAVILYEALVGRPPFRSETPDDTPRTVAARHIMAPPPPPRSLNPALGAEVEVVLLRALAKDPVRRFVSCIALIAALEDAFAPMAVSTALLRPVDEPETVMLPSGTVTRLADEPDSSPSQTELLARLEAQHEADMRALTATYEEQLAVSAGHLHDRDVALAALNREAAVAREERAGLITRLEALAGVERERDVLTGRVREVGRERDVLTGRVRELEEARVRAMQVGPGEEAAPAAARQGATVVAELAPTMARLAILEPVRFGLPLGSSFAVRSGFTVGRHAESAIQIDDNFVSARHARLTREADGWWLTDLGATNGTFVNESRVEVPTRVSAGDVLRFGRVSANFC